MVGQKPTTTTKKERIPNSKSFSPRHLFEKPSKSLNDIRFHNMPHHAGALPDIVFVILPLFAPTPSSVLCLVWPRTVSVARRRLCHFFSIFHLCTNMPHSYFTTHVRSSPKYSPCPDAVFVSYRPIPRTLTYARHRLAHLLSKGESSCPHAQPVARTRVTLEARMDRESGTRSMPAWHTPKPRGTSGPTRKPSPSPTPSPTLPRKKLPVWMKRPPLQLAHRYLRGQRRCYQKGT